MIQWYAMTSHNDTCPICNSDEARYGSGYITCKWKDRDDNLYFNGNICDNCWDKIVIPLLSGKIKNNIKVVDTIKYMIDINRFLEPAIQSRVRKMSIKL